MFNKKVFKRHIFRRKKLKNSSALDQTKNLWNSCGFENNLFFGVAVSPLHTGSKAELLDKYRIDCHGGPNQLFWPFLYTSRKPCLSTWGQTTAVLLCHSDSVFSFVFHHAWASPPHCLPSVHGSFHKVSNREKWYIGNFND